MATKKKCDYCGKVYYKDGFLNQIGEASGVGDIVGGVRAISRIAGKGRNFCSTKCKNAYNRENGSSCDGIMGAAASKVATSLASSKSEESESTSSKKQETLQSVVMTVYDSEDSAQILSVMQGLIAKTDEFKSGDESEFVDIGRVVQKKIEEGIYKLKKNGAKEDDFYLQQALELKKDNDKLVLKKRRAKPMLGTGMGAFLVTYLAVYLFTSEVFYLDAGPANLLGAILGCGVAVLGIFLVKKIIK